MTGREMSQLIGQVGCYRVVPELRFKVEILDVRSAFGRVDMLIKPLQGKGEKWVSQDSVSLN